MKLTPPTRLTLLGVIIFAALFTTSRMPGGAMGRYYLIPLTIAGAAYLLTVRELFATSQYPRQIIFACLALAAVWRVPFLLQPTAPQDDLLRYVWDGRVQHLGYNPYLTIPSDPNLAGLHTPATRGMNNADIPSPYPAGAQLVFRAVTAISESTMAFKVTFIVCDFALMMVLGEILRRTNQPMHLILAYAWHPALATEVAGAGHLDIVGALFLVISFAALLRRWRAVAAMAFALAVAVKFLPIVLLPLYWRRVRFRDGVLAALVFAALYLPFLDQGHIPLGSLGIFVQRFRFNDPIFATLERVVHPASAAALAVLAGLAIAAWLRKRHHRQPIIDDWAWPMAASLACAPVIYPWYFVWLLPFLRAKSSAPLFVWSVTIVSTYFVWYAHAIGGPWQVPGWITAVEYLPVLAAVSFVSARPAKQRIVHFET